MIEERARFLRAFVTHPRSVGAILPTSRRTVRTMLDLADIGAARRIVELGAGTGVYTEEILARLGPESTLLALEIDPELAGVLARRCTDRRLRVECGSAEQLDSYLAGAKADVIVSGLPFTSLGATLRRRILTQMRDSLAPDGVALVLQYSPVLEADLRQTFGSVRRRISLLNVPPAFLFRCAPGSGAAAAGTSDR